MIIRYYVARNSTNPRVRSLATWCDRKDTSSKDGSMVPGLRRRPLIARDDLFLSLLRGRSVGGRGRVIR